MAVVAYYKGLAPLNAILSSDDIGCMFLLVVLRGEIFPDEGWVSACLEEVAVVPLECREEGTYCWLLWAVYVLIVSRFGVWEIFLWVNVGLNASFWVSRRGVLMF